VEKYQLEITDGKEELTGSVFMKIGYGIYQDDGEGIKKIHNVQ
jgi:hypothetical protein